MTKWFHKCSLEWLKARQHYLTATDVKELLPVTKTGRKRSVGWENYMKVLASKKVNLTEADCVSTGAAARGHILEPYAIDRYNEEDFGGRWLFHWDDILIAKFVPFGLAFSPDALDKKSDSNVWIKDSEGNTNTTITVGSGPFGPNVLGEVKSYSPERHMLCGYTPKGELEERWQLATAMAVCDTIDEAFLLFYNPSMQDQLYIVDYARTDLSNEIATVLEIEDNWLNWLDHLYQLDCNHYVQGNPEEEQAIIRGIMKSEELNPEGMKSVIA